MNHYKTRKKAEAIKDSFIEGKNKIVFAVEKKFGSVKKAIQHLIPLHQKK